MCNSLENILISFAFQYTEYDLEKEIDLNNDFNWGNRLDFLRQPNDSYVLRNWSRNIEIVLNSAVINIRDFLCIYYEAVLLAAM